jgi:hypothetical protein
MNPSPMYYDLSSLFYSDLLDDLDLIRLSASSRRLALCSVSDFDLLST